MLKKDLLERSGRFTKFVQGDAVATGELTDHLKWSVTTCRGLDLQGAPLPTVTPYHGVDQDLVPADDLEPLQVILCDANADKGCPSTHDLLAGPGGDQTAAGDHHQPVTTGINLGHQMTGEKDGPITGQIGQKSAKGSLLDRIQSNGGFIENEHCRITDQRCSQSHTLSIATTQTGDEPATNITQSAGIHRSLDPGVNGTCGQTHESGTEIQIFLDTKFRVQGRRFGEVADLGADTQGISGGIDTTHQQTT